MAWTCGFNLLCIGLTGRTFMLIISTVSLQWKEGTSAPTRLSPAVEGSLCRCVCSYVCNLCCCPMCCVKYVVTRLLDWLAMFDFRQVNAFLSPCLDHLWCSHSFLSRRYRGLFPRIRSGRSVNLTTHFYWGTALQTGRSRVRFPMVPLEFFSDVIFRSHYGPGVYWTSNRSEHQEYFLGVKAAGA
jgi:hypothetical protein